MNIVPAVDVELVSTAALSWTSNGTELVAPGPTLRVRSNIPYTLGDVSIEDSGPFPNVRIRVDGRDDRAAKRARDYDSQVIQTIDYGVPVIDSAWHVDIVYTVLPASI